MKSKLTTVFAALFMVLAVSCDNDSPVSVDGVKLDSSELDMLTGETRILTAEIAPADAGGTPEWTSSDDAVATVTPDGMVTAVGAGEAVITASLGGCSSSCRVSVLDYPEIGDYFYADGTWSTDYNSSKNVIGIVFQTYKNDKTRFGKAERESLAALGTEEPRGLVMSCRMAGESVEWSVNAVNVEGISPCGTVAANYRDISGLGNTNAVKALGEEMDEFPAFRKAAVEFNALVPAPSNTTGWFLPSSGQCWDILQNLGKSPALADKSVQDSEELVHWVVGAQNDIIKELNDAMAHVPAESKDEFADEQEVMWTSTEHEISSAAMDWDFTSFGFLSTNYLSKNTIGNMTVRAVLAF